MQITLHPKDPTPHMTAAHEMGHYIDFAAFGKHVNSDTLLRPNGKTSVVMDAIYGTDSHNELVRRFKASDPGSRGWDTLNYLLEKPELFARAYAQFIATRSGSGTIKTQLDTVRIVSKLPTQWSDIDSNLYAMRLTPFLRK